MDEIEVSLLNCPSRSFQSPWQSKSWFVITETGSTKHRQHAWFDQWKDALSKNKIMSKPCSNHFGLPQGSKLGSILLNIFINDNIKINSCQELKLVLYIYADEVQLLCSSSLQPVKITCRDKPKRQCKIGTVKIIWMWIQTKLDVLFLQHPNSTNVLKRFN